MSIEKTPTKQQMSNSVKAKELLNIVTVQDFPAKPSCSSQTTSSSSTAYKQELQASVKETGRNFLRKDSYNN